MLGMLAIVGLAGISLGLITEAVRLTIGFGKVVEIEKLIDPDASRIQKTARILGSHLVGWMLRTITLCVFFMLRRFPGYGVRTASKWGNVNTVVPWRQRGWVIVPAMVFWFSVTMVFVCYGLAKWLETGSPLGY